MKKITLDKLMNTTPIGSLLKDYWITRGGAIIPKERNEFAEYELTENPDEEILELSDENYQILTDPLIERMIEELTEFTKHLPGKHDQSTHAGKKSYKSIDDIVKDGLEIQEAIDELGGSNVENGNVGMRVLLERMGKGGKPEIVASISDLDGDPIYRGTPDENAENFINGNYDRIGLGHNGDGYYFSNKGETALQYAGRESVITAGWKQDAKVMKFTNPDTALIDYKIASSEAGNKWLSKLNMTSGQPSAAQEAIFDNFAKYSADAYVSDLILQGYDGVEYGQPFDGEAFTIVFNREALQVVSN